MSQQQRQSMMLVPQLRQSLEMLQMPILALKATILHEMSLNPTIEDVTDLLEETTTDHDAKETPDDLEERDLTDDPAEGGSLPDRMSDEDSMSDDYGGAPDPELDFNPDIDSLLRHDDEWQDYFLQGMENSGDVEDDEEKHRHVYDSIREPQSLQRHLLQQLQLTSMTEEDKEIASILIGNISVDGYFTGSLPDLIMVTGRTERQLVSMLKVIQTFDPPGVAATSLKECLLIQLNDIEDSPWEEEARQLITHHLDKLAAHDESFLCKALSLKPDELKHVVALIRSLNPRPGRCFEAAETEYVTPEVFVVRKNNRFITKVDDSFLPRIHISKQYRKLLEDPSIPAETKSYIRERLRAGVFLISSIAQRQETIRKIGQAIVDAQTPFLEQGVKALRPMTMLEVAEKVGVHETTVSRTVANKYMHTPQGIFEMKYFFTAGIKDFSGDPISNKSIQERIRTLVEAENPATPLSDQAIEKALAEGGIKVARRTIAKYRGILKIPATHERRRK